MIHIRRNRWKVSHVTRSSLLLYSSFCRTCACNITVLMSSYTNIIYDTPPLLQLFMIFVVLMLALNIVFIVDLTMNHQATGQWHPTHTHTHTYTPTHTHTRWRIYVTFSDHIIGIMSKSVVEHSVEIEPRRHGNTLIAIRVISDKEMVEIYVKNQLVS